MTRIHEKIKELLFESQSMQEQTILKYLLNNSEELPKQALTTVADNSFCSPTSVTRTVKKLGYNSYKELQAEIKILSIPNQVCSSYKDTDFMRNLKLANCIYIYGKGASNISSIYLFRKLIKLGFDASHINEQDLLYSLSNKTVVCISSSGETASVCKTMSDIKQFNNCKILSITCEDSTLANISDEAITYKNFNSKERDEQQPLINLIASFCDQI